jgi:Peptidase family M28
MHLASPRALAPLTLAAALLATPAARAQEAPVAIVPQPATTLPAKRSPTRTEPRITAADLMSRLYAFADDSMMGREAGTLGNFKGTSYIAAELARMGLRPAGDSGTFFQTIPLKRRSIDPASVFTAGDAQLVAGTDWALVPGLVVGPGAAQLVYGGTLGDGSARIEPAQAAGRIVVYRVLPTGMGLIQDGKSFPDERAGLVLVGLDPYIRLFSRPGEILEKGPAGETPAGKLTMVVSTAAADRLFDQPLASLAVGALGKQTRHDIRFRMEPMPYPARNVVAILPGVDPNLRGQYVAIGAHNDHVGFNMRPVDHDSVRIFTHLVRPGGAEDGQRQATPTQQAEVNTALAAWRTAHPGTARPDSIFNGADDDGSGSVSVLEIAQQMAAMPRKPRRSVLFVWHVAEEKGLYGSAWFTDHPTVPRDSIVAQLNIDMVGRGDAWDVTGASKEGQTLRGSPDYLQLVGSRRLSTELGDLVETVNRDGKHRLQLDYGMDANGHPMNIYCRSDHYEYARYGIPVTFFTTGGHSDYHQVTDEPQYIDYPHMARVAQFIGQVAERIANLDHRIVVDKPKPDPKGACQQ